MFEKVRTILARWLLSSRPRVHTISLQSPVSRLDGSVTIRYSYSKLRARAAGLGIENPSSGSLTIVEGQSSEEFGVPFVRGWHVEIPATPLDSHFDLFCRQPNSTEPLYFPQSFPQPVRFCEAPSKLIRLAAVREHRGLKETWISDESRDPGWLAATILPDEIVGRVSASCVPFSLALVGEAWRGVSESHRALAARRVEDSYRILAKQFDSAPTGTIGVRLGTEEDAAFARSASLVTLNRRSTQPEEYTEVDEALLRWQLSAIWWGALTRLHGSDGDQLLYALRLLTVGLSEDGPRLIAAVIATLTTFLSESRDQSAAAWYEYTITVGRQLNEWALHDSRGSAFVRRLSAELTGREVNSAWVKDRLHATGTRIP